MFQSLLKSAWKKSDSLVCVGLDPDLKQMPPHLLGSSNAIFEFNRAIVDATADLVCAFKPQMAYYSAVQAEDQLKQTIQYIHEKYPGIPVILDSKRGDIGSTAEMYAREAFDRYEADAVTVNPYLGGDSLEPFLKRKEKGIIVLCRTSNPGSSDFQNDPTDSKKLYMKVAERAARDWNTNGNVALVLGATHPKELVQVRSLVGEMPFLVPGVGAQGGSAREAVEQGQDRSGTGLIINSSRAILYAGSDRDFAQAARQATVLLKEEINRFRLRAP